MSINDKFIFFQLSQLRAEREESHMKSHVAFIKVHELWCEEYDTRKVNKLIKKKKLTLREIQVEM